MPIGGGGGATISDTPPSSPTPGQFWWESDSGKLYLRYNDGNTEQWIDAATGPQGPPGPVGPTGPLGPVPGVTDGSNAAAGIIGEVWLWQGELTWNNTYYAMLTSGLIPAGDWDVYVHTGGNVAATTAWLQWSINEVYPNTVLNTGTTNGNGLKIFMGGVYGGNSKASSPAYRMSVSVPTALTGSVTAYNSSSGTVNQTSPSIGIFIWARRAR